MGTLDLTRQDLENIIESDDNFRAYIEGAESAPDGATVDLIISAQEQDGDAWDDYDLLSFTEEACQRFRNYSNREVKAEPVYCGDCLRPIDECEHGGKR
jgi:hypothetical protein